MTLRDLLRLFPAFILCIALPGCLTSPVAHSGGIAAVTVPNTNPEALMAAAQSVFAESGYTVGPVDFPNSISFDKPAGGFGQAMWGSYGETTTYRARMAMIPMGGNDYRISVSLFIVNDAGETGFESAHGTLIPWSAEFLPLLNKIKAQAANAGPGI